MIGIVSVTVAARRPLMRVAVDVLGRPARSRRAPALKLAPYVHGEARKEALARKLSQELWQGRCDVTERRLTTGFVLRVQGDSR